MPEIELETVERNKRAAREQARKHGWDIDGMRVCVECGRTVLKRPTQKDEAGPYCTCESHGPPMVSPVEDGDA